MPTTPLRRQGTIPLIKIDSLLRRMDHIRATRSRVRQLLRSVRII